LSVYFTQASVGLQWIFTTAVDPCDSTACRGYPEPIEHKDDCVPDIRQSSHQFAALMFPDWRKTVVGGNGNKKGPLAVANGPSLGRKRPRRAAATPSATAPQQHIIALHNRQVNLS
jgi:hypothetical protein